MDEIKVLQRSPEWFHARLGKITGSKVSDLMPSEKAKVKFTKAQYLNMIGIAAEYLTVEWVETYTTKEMQWGIDHEDEARELVSFVTGISFRECGIFTDGEFVGASPDGVSKNHVLEIKCPGSKKHLSYLLDSDNLVSDYEWQGYLEMYCTGKKKLIFASYDPRFIDEKKQLVIREIEADHDKVVRLHNRLEECTKLLKDIIKG